MAQTPDAPDIEKVLAQLDDPHPSVRVSAVYDLATRGDRSPRVIGRLETLANRDPSLAVRKAAENTLTGMGYRLETPQQKSYRVAYSRAEWKWIDLVIGLVLWFLLNGLAWLAGSWLAGSNGHPIFEGPYSAFGLIPNLVCLPANLFLLLVLGRSRRWMALGLLTAIALNLAVGLVLNAAMQAVCAIPFFIK